MLHPYRVADTLNVADHGDARERCIWTVSSGPLSEYETFWRALIVLLTNRIRDDLQGNPNWIRLRDEIPEQYERVAMHNYSLFYYMANARREITEELNRLTSREFPRPENVFFALQASVEQLKALVVVARGILSGLGINDKFPKQPEALYETIGVYRNAFTHDPMLGRSISSGRERVPPQARLKHKSALLWRESSNIPDDEMIDLLHLEEQLWQKFALFLQEEWRFLAATFRKARNNPKFAVDLGLTAEIDIVNLKIPVSVTNPVAASGANLLPFKKD